MGQETRRALVTGAARGIGFRIAERLAGDGYAVAMVDRDEEALAAAAARVPGAVAVAADLADVAACRGVVGEVVGELGGLDALVNNAGILRHRALVDVEPDEWDDVFAVNARAVLFTMQAAVPHLRGGAGRIVNIASMGGRLPAAGEACYGASKAAVIQLTRVAALELGPLGITVNCLCPGFVPTEMGAATRTVEMEQSWAARSPLGRLGTPDDVAGVVGFLLGPDGSYVTGQALDVSGGMMMV